MVQGYSGVSLENREALLQRCAHFAIGDESDSAGREIQRLGEAKRKRIKDLEEQLYTEAARAWELGACQAVPMLRCSLSSAHPDAKSFVEAMLAEIDVAQGVCPFQPAAGAFKVQVDYYDRNGELRVVPKVRLQQSICESEYYTDDKQRHALVHAVARRADHSADEILGRFEMCQNICHGWSRVDIMAVAVFGVAALAKLLDKAHRSMQFWDLQLQVVSDDANAEDRTCCICLDEGCPLDSLCILPCAHIFHTACIREIIAVQALCPKCRQPVQTRDMSSLQLELHPPVAEPREPEPEVPLPPALRAHGSKLNAVALTLRRIREVDHTAKAIVFVQWANLEAKVAKALETHGVPLLRLLHSSKDSPGVVLKQFQEDAGSPFVLLLSLEHAAAGSNLTAASHVLFIHPMNADSVDTAVAFEKQAIGRVRRIGQVRSEIHVYRFVTRDTVEEHITRIHRQHG